MNLPSGRSYLVLRPFISKLLFFFFLSLANLSSHRLFHWARWRPWLSRPASTPGGIHSSGVQADADENRIRLAEFNVRYWHQSDMPALNMSASGAKRTSLPSPMPLMTQSGP